MLSEKTINHPDFNRCAKAANDAVLKAADNLGMKASSFSNHDTHTDRVVDDLTTLLMRLVKEV